MLGALGMVCLTPTCPFGSRRLTVQSRHPTVPSTVGAGAELVTQPQPQGRGPCWGSGREGPPPPRRAALGEDLPSCLCRLRGLEPRDTASILQPLGAGNQGAKDGSRTERVGVPPDHICDS